MTRTLAALLLAAAALTPATAAAQTTVTATVNPERRALGYELAKLLNGEERTIAIVERVLADQLPQGLMASAEVAAMEKEYPGIVKALIDAMTPILIRHMRAELPGLWDELAVYFASNMTEDELRATIAFYRGPTGARIIEIMDQEVDFGPMAADMARSGNFDVTESRLTSAVDTTAGKLLTMLTPEQKAEANRFMGTPAGRKVAALTPGMTRLITTWSNAPSPPELDAELNAALVKVVEQFTGMKIEL